MFNLMSHLEYAILGLLHLIVAATICCQLPDVPSEGFYHPQQMKGYDNGAQIRYSCSSGSLLYGKETNFCVNGNWTTPTPFCDQPIQQGSLVDASSQLYTNPTLYSIDNNISTCFASEVRTGQYFRSCSNSQSLIIAVRLYLPRGTIAIQVSVGNKTSNTRWYCGSRNNHLVQAQWVTIYCRDNLQADCVYIEEQSYVSRSLKICELQTYVKHDHWCIDSPRVFIPHGRLRITRYSAVLECEKGYKPGKYNSLACSNGRWVMEGPLHCSEILCDGMVNETIVGGSWNFVGSAQKASAGTTITLLCENGYSTSSNTDTIHCLPNGTWEPTTAKCKKIPSSSWTESNLKGIIIATSTVVTLIVLAAFGLMVLFIIKKKSNPVVVVLRPGEDIAMTVNDPEYSTLVYDNMPSFHTLTKYPTLPRSRPPIPAVIEEYSKPSDQQYPPPYCSTPTYTEPHTAETSICSSVCRMSENDDLYTNS